MITVTKKRFTLDEYHRLGELGFFAPDERVELIRGEIILMATKKTLHSVCNTLLWQELFRLIGDRAYLRVQEPIILPVEQSKTIGRSPALKAFRNWVREQIQK